MFGINELKQTQVYQEGRQERRQDTLICSSNVSSTVVLEIFQILL